MPDFGLLCDEDIACEMHAPLKLGSGLSNEDISVSLRMPITFSFANVDIDRTEYSFSQQFDNRDTLRLFKLLKRFSIHTLDELLEGCNDKDEENERLHLYRNDIRGKLRELFSGLGEKADCDNSMVYHFALYTAKDEKADRETGVRSPRVYFMVGQFGIMHILFFDPYHEINPDR